MRASDLSDRERIVHLYGLGWLSNDTLELSELQCGVFKFNAVSHSTVSMTFDWFCDGTVANNRH